MVKDVFTQFYQYWKCEGVFYDFGAKKKKAFFLKASNYRFSNNYELKKNVKILTLIGGLGLSQNFSGKIKLLLQKMDGAISDWVWH